MKSTVLVDPWDAAGEGAFRSLDGLIRVGIAPRYRSQETRPWCFHRRKEFS